MSRLVVALGHLLLALTAAMPAGVAAAERFDPLAGAGIEPRLDAAVSPDLPFEDEAGTPVAFGRYLDDGKPVILAPVDYDCRNICGVTLAGLFSTLIELPLAAGTDFELVAVSIDPREGPAEAAGAKAELLRRYAVPEAGVHFLAATHAQGDSASELADAIGFRYRYDEATDQYAHPAAAVLTPEGHLARWLYGYPFDPDDLRLALTEASGGATGTLADRVWLLCYRYDPITGAYTPAIWTGIRVAGALGVLARGGYVLILLRRERRQKRPA